MNKGTLTLTELLQNPHSFNCTERIKFFPLLKKQQDYVLYNAKTNRLSVCRGTLTFTGYESNKKSAKKDLVFVIGAV